MQTTTTYCWWAQRIAPVFSSFLALCFSNQILANRLRS